jgi:segregation and condensation protein A
MSLQLDVFEGPLDLLLYLIKKNDLEISRISISSIVDQYLTYLETLKELDIDLASEFLLMAAELAHIKSKTLLPHSESEDEEEEAVLDLVARLKEYEKFKLAALGLKSRHWLNRDVFKRGSWLALDDDGIESEEEPKAERSYEVEPFDLIRAFAEVLAKLPQEVREHRVETERISVTERIYEILEVLKTKECILFTEIFSREMSKIDSVVSFLALLEMSKLKILRIFQTSIFEPIRLERRLDMTTDFTEAEKSESDYR